MEKVTAYNKLVRDKIPQIIENSGKSCTTRILDEEDYLKKLEEKLSEELAEYRQSKALEELADLLEVLYAAAAARGYTREQLEQVRLERSRSVVHSGKSSFCGKSGMSCEKSGLCKPGENAIIQK